MTAAEFLQSIEWAGQRWGDSCCPSCGAFYSLDLPENKRLGFLDEKASVHRAGCELKRRLDAETAIEVQQ